MKNFKTESKRILDLMINSIYTNKEIFLRELISNCSDAIDKLYYKSLSENLGLKREEFDIKIKADKEKKTLTISDNGIGMTAEELEKNLGTIAKSGSLAFKNEKEKKEDIDIIGQFGVGFYSAFMAAKKIDVYTRKAASDGKIWHWSSDGTNAYEIEEVASDSAVAKKYGFDNAELSGSVIEIHLNDESKEYASRWKIEELIKRYSDHIAFPIYLHYSQKQQTRL